MTSSLTTWLPGEAKACCLYSKKDAMQPSDSEMANGEFCLLEYHQEIRDLHGSEAGEGSFQRLSEIVFSVPEHPHTSYSHHLAVEKLPPEGCLPPWRLLLRGPANVWALPGSDKTTVSSLEATSDYYSVYWESIPKYSEKNLNERKPFEEPGPFPNRRLAGSPCHYFIFFSFVHRYLDIEKNDK